MRKIVLCMFLVATVLLAAGCGGDEPAKKGEAPGDGPVVYTTFYPTTYFAERLAGDDARVVCPTPADEDAIFWMPDDSTLRAYQEADLIVVNGAEFEKWVLKTSLPEARVVNTAKPFEEEWLSFKKATTHSHGPEGAHTHEGLDGHTWMNPIHAKAQAAEIAKGLKRLLPAATERIDERLAALDADLDRLDERLKDMTAGYQGEPILASHPAYNYLTKRYGWNVVNLDLDPEEMPDEETFASIRKILEEKPARYILWEGFPLEEIANRFREDLGLESVEFSPCELLSDEEQAAGRDYLKVMQQNLANIEPVLRNP